MLNCKSQAVIKDDNCIYTILLAINLLPRDCDIGSPSLKHDLPHLMKVIKHRNRSNTSMMHMEEEKLKWTL